MEQPVQPPPPDEITPEPLFWRRREFLKDALLFTATSVGVGAGLLSLIRGRRNDEPEPGPGDPGRLDVAARSPLSTTEPATP
ncbi:MAG: mononuclear molybdenum enzyme YedY, partial [Acidobacteria bacterium]